MLIFLYGSDAFRSREKLNEIIDQHKRIHRSGLNLKYFDEESFSLAEVENDLGAMSMFKEKKLVVFNNLLSRLKKDDDFLGFLAKNKAGSNLLLFYEGADPDKRTTLFAFLKKHAKAQEFNLLEGQRLQDWAAKRMAAFKGSIAPAALSLLVDYAGSDLWQLDNELKKLFNFKEGKRIEPEDVNALVKPKIEPNIFKTIDALALRDKKRAISLVHQHLAAGDSPLYLLSMINYQIRNLLMVKDLAEKGNSYQAVLKATKLHPFVVKKTFEQAKKFSLAELKKIYRMIFQADLDIKTGKVEPKTALDLLITAI